MDLIDRNQLTCIGVVVQPHGLKGEMKARILTGVPEYYEANCREVIMGTGQGLKRLKVKSLRGSGRQWVLALEEVTDRQQATELKGAEMLLEQAALKPLEQGEYFIADLPGCRVRTTEGQEVGTISGIMETGAANLLDILSPEGQVLVPLIPEIVIRVDTQAREVTIDPPPGLLELNR